MRTIDPVYKKYVGSVARALANTDFYQYFMDVIAAGKTTFQFSNRRVEKEVDEVWVKEIEAVIKPMQDIINNPRNFLKQEEIIVNIALAKKTTPESIRHLSQHGDMIDSVSENSVRPNRLMENFKEDTWNTYENKFVYTLLEMAWEFVDKRYETIFAQMNEEMGAFMKMTTEAKSYQEKIDMNLDLRIQQEEDILSADEKNETILSRIARLHRILGNFRTTNFAKEMSKYGKIKPPLVRTNAIAKNPNLKACHKLWNFILAYTDVGYKINIYEQSTELDDEFVQDMYSSIMVNYIILKNHLETQSDRAIDTSKPFKKKPITPQFKKEIVEEFVKDYDLPDVEIRKVLVEEITMERLMQEEESVRHQMVADHERELAERARVAHVEAVRREREEERVRAREERERRREQERQEKARQAELARQEREKERKELEEKKLVEEVRKEIEKIFANRESVLATLEAERERIRKKKEEAERKEQERLEKERLAAEKAEQERLAKEKAEQERIAREKAEAERKEQERLEAERLAAEKAEQERLAAEKAEQERIAAEKAEAERKEKERLEAERLAAEKAEQERLAAEKAEQERLAAEKAAAEAEEDDGEAALPAGVRPEAYIDADPNSAEYQDLLRREAAGEVQLVWRYRKSYLAYLTNASDAIQDYYTAIKNRLLAYKGVKSRISWKNESFKKGSAQVAKIVARPATLLVYLALDPKELEGSKYLYTDASESKRFAEVPVLIKIKGDRKFKQTLELIDMLCAEKLGLAFTEIEPVDYHLEHKERDVLVEEGLIIRQVGAVPIWMLKGQTPVEETPAPVEAVAEEPKQEETPVEEPKAEEPKAEEVKVEEIVPEPVEEVKEEPKKAEEPKEEAPAVEVKEEEKPAEKEAAKPHEFATRGLRDLRAVPNYDIVTKRGLQVQATLEKWIKLRSKANELQSQSPADQENASSEKSNDKK